MLCVPSSVMTPIIHNESQFHGTIHANGPDGADLRVQTSSGGRERVGEKWRAMSPGR